MKKVIYKDILYYYKVREKQYESLSVYKRRTGFLSWFIRYSKIGINTLSFSTDRYTAKLIKLDLSIIIDRHLNTVEKPLVIDCCQEIQDLYK